MKRLLPCLSEQAAIFFYDFKCLYGGDVCSIIEEGYKHEEDGRNDMKKSNRMTNVVCVVVGLLLVLFIIGSVKDLVFAQPIRPRTLEAVDCCEVCEYVFG